MDKQSLVDYANTRHPSNQFADYDEYVKYQTKNGLSFERNSSKWSSGQQRCIEAKFENVNRNARIIDICCGDGSGLLKFKEMGFKDVTGVEISDEKIAFSEKVGYPILKRDICSGPFDLGEPYDIIYSSHTLEHVLNPGYTLLTLASFLKKDGILFLVLPYPDIGAANPTENHRFRVHCGVIPLALHIPDKGATVVERMKALGFTVLNVQFHEYREPEIHLTLTL